MSLVIIVLVVFYSEYGDFSSEHLAYLISFGSCAVLGVGYYFPAFMSWTLASLGDNALFKTMDLIQR